MGYLWLRGADPGWNTSSSVASQTRSRLGCLNFSGFASKIPVGIPQVCGFAVRNPVGIPQVCGFVVRIPVGIPEVVWLHGQGPGWGTTSFVASWSGSRLGYLRFVASQSRSRWSGSRLGYLTQSRSRLGYLKSVKLGYLKFCGFAVKIQSRIPQLRGQDPGWGTSSLWLRSQDPGWDTSRLWLLGADPGWDTLQVCGFVVRIPLKLGYLKFCGFAVKIPVGIPQVLWLRRQHPGWDTSSFVASQSRSRLG